MAYDPEARRQSNSALIIGLVALLVVGGAALAYFATRGPDETPGPTIVNTGRDKETVVVQATPDTPAPVVVDPNPQTVIVTPPVTNNPQPNTVVVNPAPGTSSTTTKTTIKTGENRNAQPAPRAPVANPPADKPVGNTTINNTIVNPPTPKTGSAPAGNPPATEPTIAPDAATNAAPGY